MQGFWARDRHLELLHACLDRGSAGPDAWWRWRGLVDFSDIDWPEQRLVPLAYSHLGDAISEDSVFGLMGGVFRRNWTQSQILLNRAIGALEALRAAGIDTLLLKGAALVAAHYGSAGVRPMADVDILVPPAQAEAAMRTLRSAGWSAEEEPGERMIRIQHSYGFRDGAAGSVDLHWFSLWSSSADGPLWDAAVPSELVGTKVLVPCPADLLLGVCAHASPNAIEPAFRWIADAVTVSRSPDMDWERLVSEAKRRNLSVISSAALGYLGDEFGIEVPSGALRDLAPKRAPRWERRGFRAQRAEHGPFRTLGLLRERHRRMKLLADEAPWHPGFITYLNSIWGFERPWQLPLHGLRRLAGRSTSEPGGTPR